MTVVVAVPELPSVAVIAQNPGVLLAVYVVVGFGVWLLVAPVLPVVVLKVPQAPAVVNVTVSLSASAGTMVFVTAATTVEVAAPLAGIAAGVGVTATALAGSVWLITAVLAAPLSPSFAVMVQVEAVVPAT
jgi:hypothetical protein